MKCYCTVTKRVGEVFCWLQLHFLKAPILLTCQNCVWIRPQFKWLLITRWPTKKKARKPGWGGVSAHIFINLGVLNKGNYISVCCVTIRLFSTLIQMTPAVRFLKKDVPPFKSVRSVSLLAGSNGEQLFLLKSWADKKEIKWDRWRLRELNRRTWGV
jgi:hypothetical protein